MNEMQNAASSGETMFPVDRGEERAEFLIEEGLELLADFRAIEDGAVRAQIRTLVAVLANASR